MIPFNIYLIAEAVTGGVIYKEIFLKFSKFVGQHLLKSLFLRKLHVPQGLFWIKLKAYVRLWYRCLPMSFAKSLRTPFSQKNSGWLLLSFTNDSSSLFISELKTFILRLSSSNFTERKTECSIISRFPAMPVYHTVFWRFTFYREKVLNLSAFWYCAGKEWVKTHLH